MEVSNDLRVLHIDFLKHQNALSHHTSDFMINKLVVRRGQVFYLRLLFNRSLQPQDNLDLQFNTGQVPSVANTILVSLNSRNSRNNDPWQVSVYKELGIEVVVAVSSPPDAIVGKYFLYVRSGNNVFKPEKNDFYLLFNPWCKDDTVFMPNEEERVEYVLNDTGYHYMGIIDSIQEKPWNFGQFEKNVLNCCILLLNKGLRKSSELRSPVLVTRAMSGLMSSQDSKGEGVLIGNWSGNYKRGVAPYLWTGSAPILQQYYTTRQPVPFGQCWVFSGILTTVLRALGIPARSVTAYESAHDTEKNLTVDIYVDEKGKVISNMTNDSVWNFHVWTDAWMKRLDLPKGCDGWQAVDGTPQELSQGSFCCGPSPLAAICNGDIFIGYDTKFIFSEVNADQLIWMVKSVNGKKEFSVISVDVMSIGKKIITKAVGQDSQRDITNEYKYPEGSLEEREAMAHAFSFLDYGRKYTVPEEKQLLQIFVQSHPVLLGDPVNFTVTLKRKTATPQHVTISASFDLQSYTGFKVEHLDVLHKSIEIHDEVTEIILTLDSNTYVNRLTMFSDEPVIKGFVVAEILESNETVPSQVFVFFQYPKISIEMPDTGRVGQPLVCICILKNSLHIPLTNAKFSWEGLGISPRQTLSQGMVESGQTINFQIKCTPVKTGSKKFIIKFTSNEVKEICAEKSILITNQPSPEDVETEVGVPLALRLF